MGTKMALWRQSPDGSVTPVGLGQQKEEAIEEAVSFNPNVLARDVLVVKAQAVTTENKLPDLIALDSEGRVHVFEFKRKALTRESIGQIVEYAAWAATLTLEDLAELYKGELADDYLAKFGLELEIVGVRMTLAGQTIEPQIERAIEYLSEECDVPIDVALFTYFEGGLIGRVSLLDESNQGVRKKQPNTGNQEMSEFWSQWIAHSGHDLLRQFGMKPGRPAGHLERQLGNGLKLRLRANKHDAFAQVIGADGAEVHCSERVEIASRRNPEESQLLQFTDVVKSVMQEFVEADPAEEFAVAS